MAEHVGIDGALDILIKLIVQYLKPLIVTFLFLIMFLMSVFRENIRIYIKRIKSDLLSFMAKLKYERAIREVDIKMKCEVEVDIAYKNYIGAKDKKGKIMAIFRLRQIHDMSSINAMIKMLCSVKDEECKTYLIESLCIVHRNI